MEGAIRMMDSGITSEFRRLGLAHIRRLNSCIFQTAPLPSNLHTVLTASHPVLLQKISSLTFR